MTQNQRLAALNKSKSGSSSRYGRMTDVASRGLDIRLGYSLRHPYLFKGLLFFLNFKLI